MKRKIIVVFEDVVVAVALVVQGHLNACESVSKDVAGVDSLFKGGVGVTAPIHVSLGEVGLIAPVPLVDQGQDPRAIGSRF